MHSVEQPRKKTDAIEHDPGGSRTVDREFQRRLTRLPIPFLHPGEGIRGNTGHLDPHEDDQQVIGGRHQTKPQRGSQYQRVDVRRIILAGNPRDLGEDQEQDAETEQQAAHEDGKAVIHEHPGEEFAASEQLGGFGQTPRGKNQERSDESHQPDVEHVELLADAEQPHDEHRQNRTAQHDLGEKQTDTRIGSDLFPTADPLRVANDFAHEIKQTRCH